MHDDLKDLFETSSVPAPRADLADSIVATALNQAPLDAANDRSLWQHKGLWGGFAAIAATLVAGAFLLTGQPSEAELWASDADESGFGELYAWVYAEDDPTQ